MPAQAADDILDAIDGARKAYQAGDMGGAKQSLDLASQLIAQKNAEAYSALLPAPLSGWTAEKVEATASATALFGGASAASRRYHNPKGDNVEVSISGDSAMIMQFWADAEQSGSGRRNGQAGARRQPARGSNK